MSSFIEYKQATWSVFCRASQCYIVDKQTADSIKEAFDCADAWMKENGFGRTTLIVEFTHYINYGDRQEWVADDLYEKYADEDAAWVKIE